MYGYLQFTPMKRDEFFYCTIFYNLSNTKPRKHLPRSFKIIAVLEDLDFVEDFDLYLEQFGFVHYLG